MTTPCHRAISEAKASLFSLVKGNLFSSNLVYSAIKGLYPFFTH
jgi:hypothetical protein